MSWMTILRGARMGERAVTSSDVKVATLKPHKLRFSFSLGTGILYFADERLCEHGWLRGFFHRGRLPRTTCSTTQVLGH